MINHRILSHLRASGFSLLEIMIVIAIIGILSAIAIPAFNDYLIRSRVAEILLALEPLKNAAFETRMAQGHFPTATTTAQIEFEYRISDPAILSTMTQRIEITPTGAGVSIAAVGNPNNLGLSAGETITLFLSGTWVSGSMSWTCSSSGTIKYAPANCR